MIYDFLNAADLWFATSQTWAYIKIGIISLFILSVIVYFIRGCFYDNVKT